MKTLIRLLIGASIFLHATLAVAHTSGASFVTLRTQGDSVVAALDFDLRDINHLLHLDANFDGALTWGEIETASAAIEQTITTRSRLIGGTDCTVIQRELLSLAQHGDGPFARVTLTYRCVDTSALSLDLSGWFDFDPGHRALLEFTDAAGVTTQSLLTDAAPSWHAEESLASRLRKFFVEGGIHLVTGYDHLAFLGVLLLALIRRPKLEAIQTLSVVLKRAFVVITAFTVAHSITLALAATGKVLLPSKPVEVTIAASVFLAAVMNLWRGAGQHGWKLAFAFGLVHGLGFAGALAELTSGGIDLLALAAFNLGIEIAQVTIAVFAVPTMWVIFRNSRNETVGLPVASLSVAALAGFWVVTRLGT